MPTYNETPGTYALDEPCWTVLTADGEPAGFEGSEPHYMSRQEAVEALPGFHREDEPPCRVVQCESCCWMARLHCGELFVYDRGDEPAVHFNTMDDLLTAAGEENLFAVQPGVFACTDDDCPACAPYQRPRQDQMICAKMIELAELSLRFGRVERGTLHPGAVGEPPRHESDTDHTVMLGLVACALASEYFPGLNLGLISMYASVHDLVEVYAGDTRTLRVLGITERSAKETREHGARMRLAVQFGEIFPWIYAQCEAYTKQGDAESVFVWVVDKILPKLVHLLNSGASIRAEQMTARQLADRYLVKQQNEIAERLRPWPQMAERLLALYEILAGRVVHMMQEDEHAQA